VAFFYRLDIQRTFMKTLYVTAMDWLYLICIWTAGTAIFLMSLIIPWGVFTRYVLGTGSQWPEPIAILLMMVFTFIGAAATYRSGGDIAIVMLTERLPSTPRRTLEIVVSVIMVLMCMFVVWFGISLCMKTMGQSISELSWLPVGITYLAIPIGAALTLLFVIEKVLFGSQESRDVVRIGEHGDAPLAQEGAN
jgi:TRAP-type C4-dicarboxylate transport system permease small subunit